MHSNSAHLLLNNRDSMILIHMACILNQGSVSNQPGTKYAMKKDRTLENAFYSPWASALGWDQVHVNTTLPGFIDDAFCGILIGAVVMPRKNVSMKMECTMLGGGRDRMGQRGRREVSERSTTPLHPPIAMLYNSQSSLRTSLLCTSLVFSLCVTNHPYVFLRSLYPVLQSHS